MERPLTVGQLARATGVSAKTIRYYEQVGVLPAPRRSEAGYRQYSRYDVYLDFGTFNASCPCITIRHSQFR